MSNYVDPESDLCYYLYRDAIQEAEEASERLFKKRAKLEHADARNLSLIRLMPSGKLLNHRNIQMARIFTTIQINRPIKDVFEFMTTPGNWSKWHRRVIWVTGATDHSLKVDEQVTEKFTDAGHPCCVIWTVKEYEETQRWVVDGIDLKGKNAGRVTYTFKQSTNGTLFEREKIYGFSNIFSAFLDWLIIHRRKEVESAEALQRLKEYLEKT